MLSRSSLLCWLDFKATPPSFCYNVFSANAAFDIYEIMLFCYMITTFKN